MYKTDKTFFSPDADQTYKYLYAKKDGTCRKDKGQVVLSSWQAWNKCTAEDQFLLPDEYTYRATDLLLFPQWYLQLENGDTYRQALIYSNDKTICPTGNPVLFVLKNAKAEDFSEYPTLREVDWMQDKIIATLNYMNQMHVNLCAATDHVIQIVNKITPVINVSYDQIYSGVNAKRADILKVLDSNLLKRLSGLCGTFFFDDTLFQTHAGVTNIQRGPTPGTEKTSASLVQYYSYLGDFLPERAWGRREINYPGPIQSIQYSDPTQLYDLDGWMKDMPAKLKATENILSELSLVVYKIPDQVTAVENPAGYQKPEDPYYKKPLTDVEIKQKFIDPAAIQKKGTTPTTTAKPEKHRLMLAGGIILLLKLIF